MLDNFAVKHIHSNDLLNQTMILVSVSYCTYTSYVAHMQSLIFTWKWFSVILQKTMFNWQKSEIR